MMTLSTSAVVMPEQMHTIYAPRGAMLMAAMPDDKPGRQDQAIFVFDAPELDSQRQVNQAQQESARWQSAVATMSPDMRGQWESLSAQTAVTRAQGQLIGSGLKNYRVSAPFDGRLQVLDPDLRPGQWLLSGEKLGHWTASEGVRVIAYLSENEVARLQRGRSARFIPDSGVGPTLELVVDVIHSDRVRVLAEPELAVNFGGSVIVREQKGQLFPEGSYYRVELVPRERIDFSELTRFRWRGRIYVSATPEPLLASVFTKLASVLIRETGL
jgi:putative peptide zinc metalloprotease protein